MPLTPDLIPFQASYTVATEEFRIFGSRRVNGRTLPGAKAVVKGRSRLTTTRRGHFDTVVGKMTSQAEDEDGYVVDRIVFNFAEADTDAGIVIEGHYEFDDGSRTLTRIKSYRIKPIEPEELETSDEDEEPPELIEVADLTVGERNSYKGLITALTALGKEGTA